MSRRRTIRTIHVVAVSLFATNHACATYFYNAIGSSSDSTQGNRGYNSYQMGSTTFVDAQPIQISQNMRIFDWNIVAFTGVSNWFNPGVYDNSLRLNLWKATATQPKEQAFLASPELGNAYTTDLVTTGLVRTGWGGSMAGLQGYNAILVFQPFALPAADYLWSVQYRQASGAWQLAETDGFFGSGYNVAGTPPMLRLNSTFAGAGNGSLAMEIGGAPLLLGDANLDNSVTTADFNILAGHFNQSGQVFTTGDFNFDGMTNALDFGALATNFGISQAAPIAGSALPEPGMLGVIAGAGTWLRRKRGASI